MSGTTKGAGFIEEKSNTLFQKTNHILAIGIDEYKYQKDLNNPVDDCQKIIEILCERYHFENKNVTRLYNQDATREKILDKLWDLRCLTKSDNLLILFSGHGYFDDASNVGFWIPVNGDRQSKYITNHDITLNIKAFNAHHITLMIDSCFSGTMTTRNSEILANIEKDYPMAIRSYKKQSRWAMTSGRIELVHEGNKGENSPFASSIISELTHNEEKMLLFSKLGFAVREITNRNADQDPSCNYLREVGDMNGEFSFILKDN